MTRAQSVGEEMNTKETGACEQFCAMTDSPSTEDNTCGGLGRTRSTDAESVSMSEKQQPEPDRCPFDGIAGLPVAVSSPLKNNLQSSTKTSSAQPFESRGDLNPANAVSDHGAVLPSDITSCSNLPKVSLLPADSEAVCNSSVKTTVASATSDTDPVLADDNRSLDSSQQVQESLSLENIQHSASESHVVRGSLYCSTDSLHLF